MQMVVNRLTKVYMAESYYNYNSCGAPYYIFCPNVGSVRLVHEERVDCTEPVGGGNNNHNRKGVMERNEEEGEED